MQGARGYLVKTINEMNKTLGIAWAEVRAMARVWVRVSCEAECGDGRCELLLCSGSLWVQRGQSTGCLCFDEAKEQCVQYRPAWGWVMQVDGIQPVRWL